MPTQVQVPNVGVVEFPDGMSQDDIVGAIKTKIMPGASMAQPDTSNIPVVPTMGMNQRVQQPYVGQGQDFATRSLLPLPLIRDPQNALEGGANSLVKGLGSLVSPLGVATAPLTAVKALQVPLMALFGGLGAKGVGQGLGQLAGTPDQTTGQKAEQIGDVLQQGLMMLPALAHGLPEAAAPAPQVADYMQTVIPRPLTVDEINQRAGLTPNLPNSKATVTPPVTPENHVPTVPAVSPFDKGKVMSTTPAPLDAVAAKAEIAQQPTSLLQQRYQDSVQVSQQLMEQGRTQEAVNNATQRQFIREELQNREQASQPKTDEDLRTETTESIVKRTKVGTERDQAFSNRAAALKRVAQSLNPGDVIIDADGNRREVDQVLKDGTVFVFGKDGDKSTSGEWSLNTDDTIERKDSSEKVTSQATPLTFQPGIKVGDTIIQGEHNPLAQKAYMDAQAAGQPKPVVQRGFVGSDGSFLTNPLDVLRAKQKAQANETGNVPTQQPQAGGIPDAQRRQAVQEGGEDGASQQPVEKAQGEVSGDAGAGSQRASSDNQQGVGGRVTGEPQVKSGSVNEPNRNKTTGESGFTLVPKEVWPKLGFAKDFKVAGEMLYNRLRNVIGDTSATWQALQSAGLRDFLKEKRTTDEVKQWAQENGPRVEVRKFGEVNLTPQQQEYSKLRHEWWDNLSSEDKVELRNQRFEGYSSQDIAQAKRLFELEKNTPEPNGNKSHWSSIAPKSEHDMPGYTEIAVVKPTRIVGKTGTGKDVPQKDDVQFPSSHSFPPNTLGFARGYMENVGGKKVFHVIEVQSDWAQRHRENMNNFRDVKTPNVNETPEQVKRLQDDWDKSHGDPLLPHYERLALKAAIEHARSEGATHVAVSDAETAMMTERHDRAYDGPGMAPADYQAMKNGTYQPPQAEGMRLHYDQTLPKILGELTGGKGERVEMGEHKMALKSNYTGQAGEVPEGVSRNREDLIFRNPDGTPKTSITGRMYEIGKQNPNPEFSLFGKDKGEAGSIFPRWEKTGTAKTLAEIRKAAKDPSPAMKAVLMAGDAARKKLVNTIRTSPNVRVIIAGKDAADNQSVIAGQQAAMALDAQARATFGKTDYEKALNATTALVESGNDKAELQKFIVIAKAKNDARGVEAAQFALNNYDRMQPLLARTVGMHDDQLTQEQAVGLATNSRENYIRHVFDVDKLPGSVQDKFLGGGQGNGPRGFMKMRSFDTLYHAIEAGYGPAIKTWDASKLAETRIKNGQQMVNDTTWLAGLRGIKDPTTKLPITENLIQKKNSATGDVELHAPKGYDKFSLPTGQSFAVHKGYVNLMKDITSLSHLNGPVGQAVLGATGLLKHSMLMFDTFHAIRMAAKGASLGVYGFEKGASLLEYHPQDLDNALKAGDIDQTTYNYVKAQAPKAMMLVRAGLNVGRVAEGLHSDIVRLMPLAGDFNKWVFEKETRGVMMESAIKEFDRVKAASPSMGDREIAAKVSRDMNIYFGNLGRQGLFRSKTFQDLSRLMFLAPSWFESMAKTEAGSVVQAGKYVAGGTKKPLGSLAKGTGSLLFAMFVGTQLVNYMSRGQPTWDNEEPGHKLDAWIPNIGSKGNGFWVSPFSLPMELTHDAIRYTMNGKSPMDTASQIIGNKLSPTARAVQVGYSGRDYTGQKLPDGQRAKTALSNLLPVPLPLQPWIKKSNPGQVQRQITASLGIKSEPAQGPGQIIANLRRQFLYKLGKAPQADYPVSEYDDLRTALLNGDEKTAQAAYDKLYAEKLQQHQNDANPEREAQMDFQKYFEKFAKAHGGASKEDEAAFVDTLTPHQKDLYRKVQDQQSAASDMFFDQIQSKLAKKVKGMGFRKGF